MKIGGRILWNATPIFETSQISYLMGKRFGPPFKGSIIPFGSLVEYHPVTAKDQSRTHQFGKQVLPGLFFGNALYAGECGRVTYWLQTIEEFIFFSYRHLSSASV